MFAVVFIADFSLQAVLRHEPQLWSHPVALIDNDDTKVTVVQATRPAREAGVSTGLTSPQALARCSQLILKVRSRTQEQSATDALLHAAYSFSPRIEATADGVCTIDLQGLSFETKPGTALSAWAERLVAALGQLNFHAPRIGIGKTPTLAFHAARSANPILIVEDSGEFMAALPIENIEPPPHIFDVLRRWGIRTIGAFTTLGKDKIAERLGPEGIELFERACAEEIRPLDLITPGETFNEAMDFEIEIESLQPLLFVLNRFVEQLAKRLAVSSLVAEELQLRLNLSSGDRYEHVFAVPAPTANVTVLFRMLQTHLETIRTDASIVALELSAKPTRSENFQFGLFETALRDPNQFSETLARLTALCGNGSVGTPALLNTFRPDAFKMERPRFDTTPSSSSGPCAPAFGLRLRRFRPAFHADVDVQNGAPVFINSLKFSSPIQNLCGPFRSSGHWWEQEKLWSRDEWDIQTRDGTLYRIYRENNDWFIEGVYD